MSERPRGRDGVCSDAGCCGMCGCVMIGAEGWRRTDERGAMCHVAGLSERPRGRGGDALMRGMGCAFRTAGSCTIYSPAVSLTNLSFT